MSTSMEKLSPYFDSFSEKVKQRRNELSLTVNALSEKSGVPYSNVSRINAGTQANPLLFNCAAMADVMGLSLDELCGLSVSGNDDSQSKDRLHALELESAQKDAEIQRLKGLVNTATATADGFKKLDEYKISQSAAHRPVEYAQFVTNIILTFFLVVYLVIDFQIKDAGLIRFGSFSVFVWIIILIIAVAVITVTISFSRYLGKAKKKK